MPSVLKTHLTAEQANRLKSVIEDIGGVACLESHLVTPGEQVNQGPADSRRARETGRESIVCPSCGWNTTADAKHCPMCLRKFRDLSRRRETLQERVPETNPLEVVEDGKPGVFDGLIGLVRSYQVPLLIGAVILLIVILVSK
jgi:hypothetical protein